ncbi:hypothetical protein GCM10007973_29470 [Polymorphobacter multimanifer]|nr:hypothetical protein GCM10007973_29470 [Polymorphobacter multimanifer]
MRDSPAARAAATIRWALLVPGGGRACPGAGRGPPMPVGKPVSISSDLPPGVM